MPQLDGLRAFAVGAVLIHHFFQPARIGGVDLALLGVWLRSERVLDNGNLVTITGSSRL